jgi:structural maintenance of chromosomes protein 5
MGMFFFLSYEFYQSDNFFRYIPGSIVRIQLHNFVTYDYVQFRPGPYLNMIFGPNGTGKSSIACAIALGLNFPPSVCITFHSDLDFTTYVVHFQILGRASELNSFVKIGTDKGYIEIELKGPKGKGNLVVRRNLSSTSNSSTFSLNGSVATGQEIKQKMLELNIQVGNLWCEFWSRNRVLSWTNRRPPK